MTQLYRHFDEFGNLLYVGISMCACTRMLGHKKSEWFRAIRTITITPYRTRKQAILAEFKAIKSEKPKYNVYGLKLAVTRHAIWLDPDNTDRLKAIKKRTGKSIAKLTNFIIRNFDWPPKLAA